MQDMQAKQQEVQTVLNGLSDDVKELMAQRDSEILAAAQAEEAARKAAAAAAASANTGSSSGGSSSGGGSYAGGTPQQTGGSGKQQAVVNACYSTLLPARAGVLPGLPTSSAMPAWAIFGGNDCLMVFFTQKIVKKMFRCLGKLRTVGMTKRQIKRMASKEGRFICLSWYSFGGLSLVY